MSAQLEDGYTRIANELLDHVMKTKFNGTQYSILLCIIRNTYGYQRKSHPMSLSFIESATSCNKDVLKRELNKLIECNVIKVFKEATFNQAREIGINKYTDDWEVPSGLKGTEGTKKSPLQGTNQSPPQGTKRSPNKERFKEIKEITTTQFDDFDDDDDFKKVNDAYQRIHGVTGIKPKDWPIVTRILKEAPVETVISVMEERFEKKASEGGEVNSFAYYEKAIRDRVSGRLSGKGHTSYLEEMRKELERNGKASGL